VYDPKVTLAALSAGICENVWWMDRQG